MGFRVNVDGEESFFTVPSKKVRLTIDGVGGVTVSAPNHPGGHRVVVEIAYGENFHTEVDVDPHEP